MELACAFIQKTAVEKALPELDKRLVADYEIRKQARQEGRRYYDSMVLTYQVSLMFISVQILRTLYTGGVSQEISSTPLHSRLKQYFSNISHNISS